MTVIPIQPKRPEASARPYYQQDNAAVFKAINSSPAGLSSTDAQQRLDANGPNVLPQKAEKSLLMRFLAHFKDVLIYILLAAAVITAVMGHWVDTFVILGVAVINALIGFIQESNAEKHPEHDVERCHGAARWPADHRRYTASGGRRCGNAASWR